MSEFRSPILLFVFCLSSVFHSIFFPLPSCPLLGYLNSSYLSHFNLLCFLLHFFGPGFVFLWLLQGLQYTSVTFHRLFKINILPHQVKVQTLSLSPFQVLSPSLHMYYISIYIENPIIDVIILCFLLLIEEFKRSITITEILTISVALPSFLKFQVSFYLKNFLQQFFYSRIQQLQILFIFLLLRISLFYLMPEGYFCQT